MNPYPFNKKVTDVIIKAIANTWDLFSCELCSYHQEGCKNPTKRKCLTGFTEAIENKDIMVVDYSKNQDLNWFVEICKERQKLKEKTKEVE